MKIKGQFQFELDDEPGYASRMGHSSNFYINGIWVLGDDGDGNLSFSALPKNDDAIISATKGSVVKGRVVKAEGRRFMVEGEGEGVQASLTEGRSCHATWRLARIDSVEGTFGCYNSLDEYNAAAGAHRKQYMRWDAELIGDGDTTVEGWRLTPLGLRVAKWLLEDKYQTEGPQAMASGYELRRVIDFLQPDDVPAELPAERTWRFACEALQLKGVSWVGNGLARRELLRSDAWNRYLETRSEEDRVAARVYWYNECDKLQQ